MRRLNAPRRMISMVEGEGLFNDATALVAYRVAVTAVVVVGTRLAWLFTVPYLIRAIDRRPAQRARRVGPRWRSRCR